MPFFGPSAGVIAREDFNRGVRNLAALAIVNRRFANIVRTNPERGYWRGVYDRLLNQRYTTLEYRRNSRIEDRSEYCDED